MNQCSEHGTSFGGGCGINEKLESLYSGSPIYLMSNIYQVTSQCGLNASMEDFYLPLREVSWFGVTFASGAFLASRGGMGYLYDG